METELTSLERLVNQCKNSHDVDAKVDALAKLQAEFESGAEIADLDSLLAVLKTCLRTPNQHLTTATLSSLPPLLSLLFQRPASHASASSLPRSPYSSTSSVTNSQSSDIATLRHVLHAFLPGGGIIDRLGDKERSQLKARESLVLLGGFAFRSTPTSSTMSKSIRDKGQETPLAIFERVMRENGLSSKVWKIREQSLLIFVNIRRAHHQFPIRPYLSLLVDLLEDTDAHVRDCARQSVVELFTGPGVTDAARADLKKEMSKKGVRKTIVDGVLSQMLSRSTGSLHTPDGSENGDANTTSKTKGEYVPPSLMLQQQRKGLASSQDSSVLARTASSSMMSSGTGSRPSSRTGMASLASSVATTPTTESLEVRPVFIASDRDLENEFAAMAKPFEGKETEHNWAARESAVMRVRGMLKGDVHLRYTDTFLAMLKENFIQWSLKTLASLRTTVASNTTLLYSEMAQSLGPSLDPFCDTLLSNLLKMAGFTKKITAQQSQAAVTAIIAGTSAQPRTVIPLLWNTLQEKNLQARAYGVGHLKQYMEVHGHRSKHAIEGSGGLETIDKALRKSLGDSSPAVRESSRALYWTFEGIWPDRAAAIMDSLDASSRKQLEKACPNPGQLANLGATPQAPKKTSIAAAIAASRAKAKAIQNAPPTLRHQATSGSHVPPSRRAPSPGLGRSTSSSMSTSTTNRPSSPLRAVSPPTSMIRARTTSGSKPRSVSSTQTTPMPSRPTATEQITGSKRGLSPPPAEPSSFKRRTSSPLATPVPGNRIPATRSAAQIALPPSPPSSGKQRLQPNGSPRSYPNISLVGRQSTLFPNMPGMDESLLLAQTIPLPDDDSEIGDSHMLMSFSAPFELQQSQPYGTLSPGRSSSIMSDDSKPQLSNALSTESMTADHVIVEDALRARAEQAESAAERLLELVDDEDEPHHSPIPPSLRVGNAATPMKPKSTPALRPGSLEQPPKTPNNRLSSVMKQAAMFQDSPVRTGNASSLIDVLQDKKHETGWWLKRKSLFERNIRTAPITPAEVEEDLQTSLGALESGSPDVATLKRLALLSLENPVNTSPPPSPKSDDPASPSPLMPSARSFPNVNANVWEQNKNFERLFRSLVQFLEADKSEEEIEYGLIVLWEMLANQSDYLEGRESEIFSVLFRVRYANKLNVMEAANTIRDALTTKIEPVYGLTTMHANLKTFHTEPTPSWSDSTVKSTTYAFGLIALGKFIMRLPAEIAEEELPRLKNTLISALNDQSSLIVRESAAAAIIAAQLVLRDETHLFTLLDGLADEKKNLLTYLFDKHGARGPASAPGSGMDKLQKEINRLDTRTSTPSRPRVSAANVFG